MFPVPCFVFKPWYSVLHRTHYIAEASTELFIWLMSNFISVWISSTFPLLIEIYLHILNCLCFAFHLCFPFTVSESIKEGAVTLAASGSLSWAGWSGGLLFRIPAGRRQGLPSWGSGQMQSNVTRLHWWVHTRLIHTRQVNWSEPLWFEKLEKMVLYPRKCKGLCSAASIPPESRSGAKPGDAQEGVFLYFAMLSFDLSQGFGSLSLGEMTAAGELGTHTSRGYHPQWEMQVQFPWRRKKEVSMAPIPESPASWMLGVWSWSLLVYGPHCGLSHLGWKNLRRQKSGQDRGKEADSLQLINSQTCETSSQAEGNNSSICLSSECPHQKTNQNLW